MLRTYAAALAARDARLVLAGGVVSVVGDALVMVVLLLRAHSWGLGPWVVTTLLGCFALPLVLGMGLAGDLGDRVAPRRLLVLGGLAQAGAVGALALVSTPVATCLLVLILQSAFAVTNPVWNTLVPVIVGPERVGPLISLQQGMRALATPLGAALGGLLVGRGSAWAALLLSACTFVALAAVPLWLRTPLRAPASTGAHSTGMPPAARGWWERVVPRAGWHALARHRRLRVLLLALLPMIVTLEATNVVEVFLVRDVFGASATAFGFVGAAAGLGVVAGALAAGTVTSSTWRVRGILAGFFLCGAGQLAGGLAGDWRIFAATAASSGLGIGGANALLSALLLTEIRDHERARVLALVNGAARAMSVLALLLGGALGSRFGPATTFVVLGGAGLLVAVAVGARALTR